MPELQNGTTVAHKGHGKLAMFHGKPTFSHDKLARFHSKCRMLVWNHSWNGRLAFWLSHCGSYVLYLPASRQQQGRKKVFTAGLKVSLPWEKVSLPWNKVSLPWNKASLPWNVASLPWGKEFAVTLVGHGTKRCRASSKPEMYGLNLPHFNKI